MNLFPELQRLLNELISEEVLISESRKRQLMDFSDLIKKSFKRIGSCNLIFICTHNSRRSQLAELMLKAGAVHLGINGIETFSGGTEVTAFNSRMINALTDSGFQFEITENGSNPVYKVKFGEGLQQICFSKVYDDTFNPHKDFIAVTVCTQADEACPLVLGADQKLALPYTDPKDSDGTPEEAKVYIGKLREIGREMLFVLKQL